MGYRGDDLDLRTPQTWSATPSDLAHAAGEGSQTFGRGRRASSPQPRNGPIWVDDTVLAVFNHAYDVAAAHRSAEVRVEHLLHALTRIDTAAELLEAHGVRVAGLRRETATVIAGELPVASGNGPHAPRRSNDLADVLRMAAAQAYRRNAPATVEDLLAVLDQRSDLAGVQLLSRHGGHHAGHLVHEPIEPTPPPQRAPAYEAQRYADAEPRERPRARHNYRPERAEMPYRPESYRAVEYRPERTPELQRDARATSTDSFQNARLDALEQAVRNLGLDLADERGKFAGILQDLQRDIGAQRDDASRLSGGVHERLQTIEQMVSSPRDEDDNDELLDRLDAIERGLSSRLGELSRTWSGMAERIELLERTLDETRGPQQQIDLTPINDRITQLERVMRESLGDSSRHWLGLSDKLKSVEQALANPASPVIDLAPIGNRLDFIEEALISRDPEPSREVVDRLAAVEQSLAATRTQAFETTGALATEVKALSGALATQAANAERFQAAATEKLTNLAGQVGERFEAATAQRLANLASQVGERITALGQASDRHHVEAARLVDTQRSELLAAVQDVGQRTRGAIDVQRSEFATAIEAIDKRIDQRVQAIDERVQRIADTQSLYSRDLTEVHDALVKLNANQHTLAGSIDQWRTDASGDIGVIANRIGVLEREAGKPMQLLSVVAANMDTVHRIAVDRNNRRRRFWYWLFGTDDWLAASWPDQATRVDRARLTDKTRRA